MRALRVLGSDRLFDAFASIFVTWHSFSTVLAQGKAVPSAQLKGSLFFRHSRAALCNKYPEHIHGGDGITTSGQVERRRRQGDGEHAAFDVL